MQAHTDRVAHNPTPPTTPLLTRAVAFLWIYDAAIRLPNTVAVCHQCPGEIKVFDTATWTVGGEMLGEYLADVDDMGDFVPETNVISDGYFHESEFRSAPYFDLFIDGITNIDA